MSETTAVAIIALGSFVQNSSSRTLPGPPPNFRIDLPPAARGSTDDHRFLNGPCTSKICQFVLHTLPPTDQNILRFACRAVLHLC